MFITGERGGGGEEGANPEAKDILSGLGLETHGCRSVATPRTMKNNLLRNVIAQAIHKGGQGVSFARRRSWTNPCLLILFVFICLCSTLPPHLRSDKAHRVYGRCFRQALLPLHLSPVGCVPCRGGSLPDNARHMCKPCGDRAWSRLRRLN
ncbi:uncharacterized protein BO97DRAFT_4056 [Aspergillus homomorphus CBS 101889]|uniref:Uncharacterized protein n=1 Tax=Aspergillus homomorphus (strain CBS 101889) TaxID=1450537 RepID=A0A395IB64_ASPHC|nr:hypothetical protein BO97DRAFT_4056 [Aspergillus homomorphus CBS 101889]RAL17286.1 hypothetical protein BO97DRAFT_4056 [Aspergillus homomorphus CBS 101889]